MQRCLIFAVAGFSLLMSSIDSTIVAVAFPSFTEELHTSVLWSAWTISLYYIAMTVTMPLVGNLSDTFGRKKVFLFSLILFTGSSLACGLAPNIYTLIIFRFFQGIGGAGFLPTASGIVSDTFPEHRQRVIGLFSSIFPLGGIIGPNLGGWIVSRYSWREIFYVNVPIGIVLIAASIVLLKGFRRSAAHRIDFTGALLFSMTVLSLMLGLNMAAEGASPLRVVAAAACLAFSCFTGVKFLFHERGQTNPILDLTLLQSKPFLAANMVNVLIGGGALGVMAFIPLYATSVLGVSTLMSGMVITPRSAGMIVASAITSFMLARWGYRRPMLWGLTITALSTALLDLISPGQSTSVEVLSLLMLLAGLGSGVAFPACNNACIELMPEKVSTIVGLRGMCRMVGAALAVSLITLILHISPDARVGFEIAFPACGVGLLAAVPLVFLMPSGRKVRL